MVVVSKVDYKIFRRFKWPIYVIVVALLVAVKFVGKSARTVRKDG